MKVINRLSPLWIVKTIDYESRGVRFTEKAPRDVIEDALARVRALVS